MLTYLLYAWLIAMLNSLSIDGHFVDSTGEGIPFINIDIKGSSYEMQGSSDFDGYSTIYVHEAKLGDTCYLTFSAVGYFTQHDTIVLQQYNYKKYVLKAEGEK
jgi:hypothetical protein